MMVGWIRNDRWRRRNLLLYKMLGVIRVFLFWAPGSPISADSRAYAFARSPRNLRHLCPEYAVDKGAAFKPGGLPLS